MTHYSATESHSDTPGDAASVLRTRTPANGQVTASMLQVALEMVGYGWRVFPVRPPNPDGTCSCNDPACTTPGKHPAIGQWPIRATTSVDQVHEWWQQWPRHNVGIATGTESNLLVLDVDGAEGRASIADGRSIPEGPAVSTGRIDGGTHHYLQCPEDLNARNFAGLVPGLDARANGGYVIAAGSLHASGHRYRWTTPPNGNPLPEPSQWLVDMLKAANTRAPLAPGAKIPKGQRDETLTRIAGAMRRQGSSADAILAALRVVNRDQCDPPLNDDSLEKVATSIGRRPPAGDLITASLDDLGNGERFARMNYDLAMWLEEEERWITWDGRRWARGDLAVSRLARDTARAYQLAAATLPTSATDRDAHIAHAARLQRNEALVNMVKWARADMAVKLKLLDQHPWLLNCSNGTVDLRTGKLKPHDPTDLLTQIIEVAYDPAAKCPVWDGFISRAMKDRPATLGYLQRMAGIMLTGDVSVKFLPIIWGLKDTGKSVLTNTLRRLLNEYAQVMSEATLAHQQRKAAGGEASPDLARLVGIRLAVTSETGSDFRLNEGRIKAWTGRTPVTARHLHGHQFDFEPTHKILIETNNRPIISGGDEATWGRVQLIPFTEVIPKPEQDEELEEKLAGEFPGILTWAVRGCLEWQASGLKVPADVQAATEQYQETMDPLQDFFEARCQVGPDHAVSRTDLWEAYLEWAKQHDGYPLGKQRFNALLEAKGFEAFRDSQNKNARSWRGIGCRRNVKGESGGSADEAIEPWLDQSVV